MSDFTADYTSIKTDQGLMAEVVNGVIKKTEQAQKVKTADEMNALGKDAFLRLLCAQMEYQDPLEPTDNTEWISQLATYSSLEEMQNMNKTLANAQAFSLIGQEVILATKNSAGDEQTVSGQVEYVSMKSGTAYLSIKGMLYPAEDLQSVIDPSYLANNVLPKVVDSGNIVYDKASGQDFSFRVSFGGELGKAEGVGLSIGNAEIDPKYVKATEDGYVTVAAAALADMQGGTYAITVKFDNDFATEDSTSLTLTVVDSETEEEETAGETETGTGENAVTETV